MSIVSALLLSLIKATALLVFVLLNVMFIVWMERKVGGFFQARLGPNRVGPYGLLQTLADALKLIGKEDIIPRAADRWLFVIAPILAFAPALMVWVVIPFGRDLVVADLPIAIVYIAAVTSFMILSIFMSGWGSNNKYALYGAMRGAAQMISYEVSLIMSIIGVVMIAGSMSLQDIVYAQIERGNFGVFIFVQPLGFLIFLISGMAELNRAPFDLAEAESELVNGYHTEYSGIRWGMFMLSEFANMFAWSAIAATLFLGGWAGPVFGPEWLHPVLGFIYLMVKTYAFIFLNMWIRWTLPRIRIDQLMDLGWKFLLPAALLNIALTGIFLM